MNHLQLLICTNEQYYFVGVMLLLVMLLLVMLLLVILLSKFSGMLSLYAQSVDLRYNTPKFDIIEMNDLVTMVTATSGNWRLYEDADYTGNSIVICEGVTLGPHELEDKGFKKKISSARRDDTACSLEIWEDEHQGGDQISIVTPTSELTSFMNDRGSTVRANGGPWRVFEHKDYKGKSMVICEGDLINHTDLANYGLADKITSAKPVKSC